jgi:hypothetical protein
MKMSSHFIYPPPWSPGRKKHAGVVVVAASANSSGRVKNYSGVGVAVWFLGQHMEEI